MKFLKSFVILALLIAPVLSANAATKSTTAQNNWVSIPFVNYGNIQDWRAVGRKAILIASSRRHWYKATFYSPCIDLPYALRVGFVTGPVGSLDKFSSILVHGQRCWFKSLKEVPSPQQTHPTAKHTS